MLQSLQLTALEQQYEYAKRMQENWQANMRVAKAPSAEWLKAQRQEQHWHQKKMQAFRDIQSELRRLQADKYLGRESK